MSFTLSSSLAAAAIAIANKATVQTTPAEPPAEEAPVAQPAPPERPSALNSFNPQISLLSDFRSRLMNSESGGEKLSDLKELELGLAADVDPFLRAEAYISFAREDGESIVEVEEAFARYTRLAKGVSGKVGRIAGAIGRIQRNHGDQLNWLDYPLVVQDFLGDEGLRAPGASVSYLFPGDRFHELTFEALVPQDGPLFMGSDNGKPVVIGHYRTFVDFNEDLSAQFGASVANGPGSNDGRASMAGLDFTMKWQPGSQSRSLVLESEAYWGKPGGPGQKTSFGAFAAATYQLTQTLYGYLKFDDSQIPGTGDRHRAWTVGFTVRPTEFHHWRIEYQNRTSNFGDTRNTLDIQFQWLIGSHPAHKY